MSSGSNYSAFCEYYIFLQISVLIQFLELFKDEYDFIVNTAVNFK